VASAEAFQVKLGVSTTPLAPFAGEVKTGAGGADNCVVNDQVAELAEPPLFLATTCQ